MGSWRVLVVGWGAILALCLAVGSETSMPAVVPPLAAAAFVLVGAALASDYFGIKRRATPWRGQVASSQAARMRVAALEQRFQRDREVGSVRTPSSARALLVALVETSAWSRTADVVDFLAADALTRPHQDPVADALRACALLELGRAPEAKRLLDELRTKEPVVAWVRARQAEREGRLADAEAIANGAAKTWTEPGVRRDLLILRASLLARIGHGDRARVVLGDLIRAGFRRDVEHMLETRDARVSLVAQEALGLRSAYRAA
ncbi:MAG TPA: hypothetical protein VL463_21820 [Kofleriaceae bacterium]|jgi:hypothetical protein|nr:hypothetical protein [Kofleriaceae bacterium]